MAFGAILLSLVYTSDNQSGTELRFKHRKIQRAIRPLRPVGIQSVKRLPDRSEQVSEGLPLSLRKHLHRSCS